MMRSRQFTLIEVVVAVAIAAVALLGLQTAVSGALDNAGDSINKRAAREEARKVMEEIIAGVKPPEGDGSVENRPNFNWSSTSREVEIGVEGATPEKVLVVTLELTYPQSGEGEAGQGNQGKITLRSVVKEEEQ